MDSLSVVEGSEKKRAMWLYPKVMGFNPSERWGHSACYSQRILYVFGGCCGGLHFGDILLLNLDTMTWTAHVATSGDNPGPRDSHSAAVVGRRMIVFGGTDGTKKVNDLHIFDLDSKTWTRPECHGTAPSPRESHTTTTVAGGRLVVFGGSGEGEGNYLNDLHVLELDTMTWSSPEVKGDIPVPRDSHGAVSIGNKLFVYGGDCGDRYNGDVDMLDLDTYTWSRLSVQGCSPGVRAGHSIVNIGNKVYIIGGVGEKHYYNDVWVLDVSTCSWTRLEIGGQQPQGRFSHTAVVTDLDIAIFGGCGEDELPLNELLVLQLGSEHPCGRYNISMCKIFGKHWNQFKRKPSREVNHNTKNNNNNMDNYKILGDKHSAHQNSDTIHLKRRRTMSTKAWDVESEQEEHSLSLSQSSSPSLSDQEPTTTTTTHRASEYSPSGSQQGFNLFKKSTNSPIIEYQSQPSAPRKDTRFSSVAEQKFSDSWPAQNMIGSDVRGKVDGAFDSGYLMTATVNGKLFRGVLFPPGVVPVQVPRGPVLALPIPVSNQPNQAEQRFRQFQRPTKSIDQRPFHSFAKPNQMAIGRSYPVVRASPSPPKSKEKTTLRSDLQGVVLTLGGPGSSSQL